MSDGPQGADAGAEGLAGSVGPEEQRARPGYILERGLGVPALFAVAYTGIGSSIYVVLGVVAGDALGLTPFVMLGAGIAFAVTSMTYMEASVLHPEPGGSTVFARYAFNELWSFVAGWAILLDYVIVIALTALAVPHYLTGLWAGAGVGHADVAIALAVIAGAALLNVRGFSRGPRRWWARLAMVDIALQMLVVVTGLVLVFHPELITRTIVLGEVPKWTDVIFAVTVVTMAYTGIEAASNLAPEIQEGGRALKRVLAAGAVAVLTLYVGISVVALMAVPVTSTGEGFSTALGNRFVEAPVLGVVMGLGSHGLAVALRYLVGAIASLVLFQAANAAMLGVSRLSYSLATNRQIPGFVARLHPTRSTPHVAIFLAALLAIALVLPASVHFLVGIFAFGAMIAFTLTHLSVCVLRFRDPERPRPYRVPFNVRVGRGSIPVPAALAVVVSVLAWISVVALHPGARMVGGVWMIGGVVLYVAYRRAVGMSVTKKVQVSEAALREVPDVQFGSILVPIFGTELDDDIMGTAGRLASEATSEEGGGVIEAIHVIEVPVALPVDARLPRAQIEGGQEALARGKEVGEEYEGVEVATTLVRARAAGPAIVTEARRRNVEVIVLGGEEPSRIRGGPVLGGIGGRRTPFVGGITEYVIRKAPCRVILTAPPSDKGPAGEPGDRSAQAGIEPAQTGPR